MEGTPKEKNSLELYEEMKEALAEITTDDNLICKICNKPGPPEGKIRLTKSKR